MGSAPVRKALIPAAGRGTRFLPLTKSVPKELAPIVTTPAIEFVVAEAARHGVTEVLLVLSAGKESIAEYFGTDPDLERALEKKGDEAGLRSIRRPGELATISSVRQDEPRGLGDAVGRGRSGSGCQCSQSRSRSGSSSGTSTLMPRPCQPASSSIEPGSVRSGW